MRPSAHPWADPKRSQGGAAVGRQHKPGPRQLPRTPSMRSSTSENSPSTHSGEYQALGVEESKLNSMPVLGMPARDMVG